MRCNARAHDTAGVNLHSAQPWWPMHNGITRDHPPLSTDVSCNVAVVGGGITGDLVADRLAPAGRGVVVVAGRDIGQGSTVASTAPLQYEVDAPLHRFVD